MMMTPEPPIGYELANTMSFSHTFHHAAPHGVLTAITIPDTHAPVPDSILAQLHPLERDFALTLNGYRQGQFVGGRLALRGACEQLHLKAPAILADDRGAPALPKGFTGSVSHKRKIAVGMVACSLEGSLGVDIEDYGPPRPAIAPAVLSPKEMETIDDLEGESRWMAILQRFSIKEAIYKALDPYVRRYVGFHEVALQLDTNGNAHVELLLKHQEGPFQVSAKYAWIHGRLLSSARIKVTDPSEPG
jgi:enterobactin synthetase component D